MTRRAFTQATVLATAALAAPMFAAEPPGPLKAAVIGHTGHGDYGHGWDEIFTTRPGIELVALADPDPTGRARTAAKIKAPRAYADYRELLDLEKPDLVSLAMRHADQHHPIALAALRAGAHLYCEKPFVTTPAESDELHAEARKRARKIAVAHTLRMMPSIVRFRQAVADGLLGELVEARACGKQDTRAGGEDMMVLGTHVFDLLRLFLGDPTSCTARVLWQGRDLTAADRRIVKDNVGPVAGDQISAQFAFARGVHATFTSAEKLRDTTGYWGIELLGSKGAARINCDLSPHVFLRRADPWKPVGRTEQWEPYDPSPDKTTTPPKLAPVTDWLDAIARNREPECSGRNGAWAVEMAMAVYHAALTARRVTFPLPVRTHPLA